MKRERGLTIFVVALKTRLDEKGKREKKKKMKKIFNSTIISFCLDCLCFYKK
tara:strand:+ start:1217 stop:1372 length:156 start_codon:yes stop_codon:yes gene_type:complete